MADGAFLTNADRLAADCMAEVLTPPPPVDLNLWAVHPEGPKFGTESPFPGPYNPDLFPEFRRILEVLGPEHPARIIIIMKSAQIGGTVLAQIFLGGCLDLDPSPFLYVHPTSDNAIRWVKTKWRAMVRQTSALSRLFPQTTSRDGNNSMLFQERVDGRGSLLVSGANSEASLSMISMPKQVQDDLSKWEMNNAGDPEGQADSRSKAFEWAKILKISTPLLKGSCRISRNFTLSTQEHYHMPCPQCGHMQPLEWPNFLANIDEDKPDSAFFTCASPACGGVIENHHLPEMKRRGKWIAENPSATAIGFYLWAAYSNLASWKRIREDWLRAKGDPKAEQTFVNDTVGLPYEAAGESPPWEEIKTRAEATGHKRGVIPNGGLLLTAGADCQADRVEVHIKAYGKDLRCWTIDYFVVDGHISEAATMAALDVLINRTWPDSFGNRRHLNTMAIDGNAWTEDVFTWVKRHPSSRLMMVRGIASDQAPLLARVKRERTPNGDLKKHVRRFFNVGVSPMKMSTYKNIAKADPLQRGFYGFPVGMEDDFYQQLCAERREGVRKRDGSVEYRWTKDAAQRNEVLDTSNYADAAAIRAGWRSISDPDWDRLSEQLEQAPKERQPDLEDLLASPAMVLAPATDMPPAQSAQVTESEAPTSAGSEWLAVRDDKKWLG